MSVLNGIQSRALALVRERPQVTSELIDALVQDGFNPRRVRVEIACLLSPKRDCSYLDPGWDWKLREIAPTPST